MTKPKDILDKKLYAFFMIYGIKISDKSMPYIVQAMHEYAEEYHRTELLKLNKSDVISSVCICGYPNESAGYNTNWKMVCSSCGKPKQTDL